MIDIYSISGIVLAKVPISSEAVIHEELMASDYIKLSWVAESNAELPAGSYIEYNGERYSLLAPYRPTSYDEVHYKYEPEFSSRVMLWDKTPACIYTYELDGYTLKSREFEWNFVGAPADALFAIAQSIYNETGERWSYEVAEGLPASISLNVSNNSIFAVLSNLAEACETEWWTDKANNVLHLSKCERFADMPLEVGVHVGTPSISANNEGYYSRFYALGSTRNIVEETVIADSIAQPVNKRLTLDPKKYPDGYKDIAGHFEDGVYVSDLKKGEIFAKTLVFEEIFPSSHLTIASARKRLKYRLKDGEKIKIGEDTASNPIYEQYAIWYFKIEGFEFTEDLIIEGKTLSVNFKTGKLAGREFELHYHDKADSEQFSDDVEPFEVEAGDYEIIIDESEGTILPSVDYIIPEAGDKIILFNINMPAEYTDAAQIDLENALDKEIAKLLKDNNNYELESYPYAFQKNALNLELGRKVLFKYGGHEFLTRVLMVEKNLDCEYQQKVRLGNQMIKGSRQQLKDEVRNVGEEVAALKEQEKVLVSLQRDYAQSLRNTVASYLGLKDTISLLQGAFDGFSEGANPVTVETMLVMLGDNSLQYRIVNNIVELVPLTNAITYDSASRHLNVAESAIVHYTLGINDIQPSSSRDVSQYLKWNMPAFTSGVLNDADVQYYLFARVPKDGTVGEYKLVSKSQYDDNKISLESEEGYYNLLVGILNKEYSGTREFVRMYGYTAVGAGQISTDVIKSSDGKTYFDLLNGVIAGDIRFITSSGTSKDISTFAEEVQDQIDGVVENWNGEEKPTAYNYPVSQWTSDADKIAHINDTYVSIEEYVDDETTPNSGKMWRWCECGVLLPSDEEIIEAEFDGMSGYEKKGTIDNRIDKYNTIYFYDMDGNTLYTAVFRGYDTNIFLASGGIYVNVEKATGDVYVNDRGALLADVQYVKIGFKYNSFVSVTDADGNTKLLHWHPIADSDAVKALQMVSPIAHLKNTFAEGQTNISGGVVMTQMVAVGEGGENIEAFLNGSDFASDGTHKLIFAAGIENNSRDLELDAQEAKTRIYENGTLITEKGQIAKYTIEKERLYARDVKGNTIELLPSSVLLKQGDDVTAMTNESDANENIPNLLVDRNNPLSRASYFSESVAATVTNNEANSATDGFTYTALSLAARDFALKAERGKFAGLRPFTRTVTTSSGAVLTKLDHTIMVISQSAITITLPNSPEVGQEFDIFFAFNMDVNYPLKSNDVKIHWPSSEVWDVTQTNITGKGMVKVICANDQNGNKKWWCYRFM